MPGALKQSVKITIHRPASTPPVFLVASFTEPAWSPVELDAKSISLTGDAVPTGQEEYEFSKVFQLEEGEYEYRFLLGADNVWVCNTELPTNTDAEGNLNNVLLVKRTPSKETSEESKAAATPDRTMAETTKEVAENKTSDQRKEEAVEKSVQVKKVLESEPVVDSKPEAGINADAVAADEHSMSVVNGVLAKEVESPSHEALENSAKLVSSEEQKTETKDQQPTIIDKPAESSVLETKDISASTKLSALEPIGSKPSKEEATEPSKAPSENDSAKDDNPSKPQKNGKPKKKRGGSKKKKKSESAKADASQAELDSTATSDTTAKLESSPSPHKSQAVGDSEVTRSPEIAIVEKDPKAAVASENLPEASSADSNALKPAAAESKQELKPMDARISDPITDDASKQVPSTQGPDVPVAEKTETSDVTQATAFSDADAHQETNKAVESLLKAESSSEGSDKVSEDKALFIEKPVNENNKQPEPEGHEQAQVTLSELSMEPPGKAIPEAEQLPVEPLSKPEAVALATETAPEPILKPETLETAKVEAPPKVSELNKDGIDKTFDVPVETDLLPVTSKPVEPEKKDDAPIPPPEIKLEDSGKAGFEVEQDAASEFSNNKDAEDKTAETPVVLPVVPIVQAAPSESPLPEVVSKITAEPASTGETKLASKDPAPADDGPSETITSAVTAPLSKETTSKPVEKQEDVDKSLKPLELTPQDDEAKETENDVITGLVAPTEPEKDMTDAKLDDPAASADTKPAENLKEVPVVTSCSEDTPVETAVFLPVTAEKDEVAATPEAPEIPKKSTDQPTPKEDAGNDTPVESLAAPQIVPEEPLNNSLELTEKPGENGGNDAIANVSSELGAELSKAPAPSTEEPEARALISTDTDVEDVKGKEKVDDDPSELAAKYSTGVPTITEKSEPAPVLPLIPEVEPIVLSGIQDVVETPGLSALPEPGCSVEQEAESAVESPPVIPEAPVVAESIPLDEPKVNALHPDMKDTCPVAAENESKDVVLLAPDSKPTDAKQPEGDASPSQLPKPKEDSTVTAASAIAAPGESPKEVLTETLDGGTTETKATAIAATTIAATAIAATAIAASADIGESKETSVSTRSEPEAELLSPIAVEEAKPELKADKAESPSEETSDTPVKTAVHPTEIERKDAQDAPERREDGDIIPAMPQDIVPITSEIPEPEPEIPESSEIPVASDLLIDTPKEDLPTLAIPKGLPSEPEPLPLTAEPSSQAPEVDLPIQDTPVPNEDIVPVPPSADSDAPSKEDTTPVQALELTPAPETETTPLPDSTSTDKTAPEDLNTKPPAEISAAVEAPEPADSTSKSSNPTGPSAIAVGAVGAVATLDVVAAVTATLPTNDQSEPSSTANETVEQTAAKSVPEPTTAAEASTSNDTKVDEPQRPPTANKSVTSLTTYRKESFFRTLWRAVFINFFGGLFGSFRRGNRPQ
ncbi:hypothetical protein LOZ12_002489 [Ophidiomyces ophidiicola]|uniref:Uncharacterized protein n=1 Tax=Ophidiomyces ophidiicola TaxID=1387563 RepID=A0ACB8V2R4_9EURO|nr:hypothetical protein LOZ62_001786 [Ophidiomyces ophidiicola]KAI1973032.1 hypothetical protein LOZ56_002077 [Ophidiomyces ophidiicola]KAI2006844.1 hypothetical protein LOZ50_002886 [Ophidiomyces ophidiicola]KAI2025623.1 hypothetical protein LOZ46_000554 [Ophidiomyces ophidiicola]KAI2026680.1 hypothetical protein LOZ45_002907 [Ophidiomyces ophidiicola]